MKSLSNDHILQYTNLIQTINYKTKYLWFLYLWHHIETQLVKVMLVHHVKMWWSSEDSSLVLNSTQCWSSQTKSAPRWDHSFSPLYYDPSLKPICSGSATMIPRFLTSDPLKLSHVSLQHLITGWMCLEFYESMGPIETIHSTWSKAYLQSFYINFH